MTWSNIDEFRRIYERKPVREYPNQVSELIPDPILSVKVSTYQHAPFIRTCLDGILMQETSFPFEIVIGEDESTDGTREICMEYAIRHPDKIRLFLHSRTNNIQINGRPSGRFQSTYSRFMCRGEYVALCEGDDAWTNPLKLQKQVTFLENNPDYVLTCGGFETLDNGERCQTIAANRVDPSKNEDNGFTFDLDDMKHEWLTKTLTVVHRSSAYDCADFVQYRYTRDAHLYYHLMKKGRGFYFQEVFGEYNVHAGGVYSSTDEEEKVRTWNRVYRELYDCNKDFFTRHKAFRFGLLLIKRGGSMKHSKMSYQTELLHIAKTMLLIRSIEELRSLLSAIRVRFWTGRENQRLKA